jgi:hypothetical protein
MVPSGPKDGSPGFISEGEKASFDDSQFRAGDRVPSVLTEPFRGDRGDISASWRYRSGRWTLEIRRRLVTGSNYDIQFSDLNAAYPFALATFDNTEIRHAAQEGSAELRFRP